MDLRARVLLRAGSMPCSCRSSGALRESHVPRLLNSLLLAGLYNACFAAVGKLAASQILLPSSRCTAAHSLQTRAVVILIHHTSTEFLRWKELVNQIMPLAAA